MQQPMQRPWNGFRFLPLLLIVLSLVGIALIPMTIARDQTGYEWLANELGGSGVYSLNVWFARSVPFIIAVSIGFAIWQRSRIIKRNEITGSQVRRHDTTTVVFHWVNGLAMIACLITAAWFVRWVQRPFDLETLYLLHFVAAALVLATSVHHLVHQMMLGGGGLTPQGHDIKNAAAETVGYAGVFSKKRAAFGIQLPIALRRPAQRFFVRKLGLQPGEEGKYLASEKLLSYAPWVLLIGIVVITGVLKSARYIVPIPDMLLRVSTYLHDGTMVWILVLLFFHVAAIVLVPINLPLFFSMLNGKISLDYVKQNLPKWFTEVERDNPGVLSPAPAADPMPVPESAPADPAKTIAS